MRLVTYLRDGVARVGAVHADGVVDLGETFPSMLALISGGAAALDAARDAASSRRPTHRLGEVRLLAPIPEPRRHVFCVGWNYLGHVEEGAGKRGERPKLPEHPAFFTKATRAVIGPDAEIPFDPNVSSEIDWEVELAVVIGRECRDVREADALGVVFGYTVGNDVSARDLQRRHGGQWMKGKSLDGTCPLGPWIVTADEIPEPQALRVRTTVNGVVKQDASTKQMVFGVARIVAELSLGMTLLPGDLILTGTPEGVGFARTPPEFLRPGDEVVVSVDAIGELRNRIAARR